MTEGTRTAREVEEKVVETIRGFAKPDAELVREAVLEDLDVDSLDLVELAQVMEEDFSLRVESSELERVETLGDVIDTVLAKLPSAAA